MDLVRHGRPALIKNDRTRVADSTTSTSSASSTLARPACNGLASTPSHGDGTGRLRDPHLRGQVKRDVERRADLRCTEKPDAGDRLAIGLDPRLKPVASKNQTDTPVIAPLSIEH